MVVGSATWLQCAITDLSAQGLDSPAARASHLAAALRRWAADGIDIVQLRAKELDAGEVFELARDAMHQLQAAEPANARRPRLLLNGRPDIALAAGADGVHLTARPGELTPAQVRALFAKRMPLPGTLGPPPAPFLTVSCHTVAEVLIAHRAGADAVLFGPVFEKRVHGTPVAPGLGLQTLAEACAHAPGLPVLALGGVTAGNLASCLHAGAAGVAGIRLFDPFAPDYLPRALPPELPTT